MEGTYPVKLGCVDVGTVLVKKQGLYWLFECVCRLSGEVMYDLIVSVEDKPNKLALLIPEDGSFTARAKQPMKQIGKGKPVFSLRPRHAQLEGVFVPVYPEEPFRYLSRLENAYLAIQNGQTGLEFSGKKIMEKSKINA